MNRTFPHPNLSHGWVCPVCRTSADSPVMLIPIPGTEEGGIVQAEQVHAECVEVVQRMMSRVASRGDR